jgi:hypothetical protein
LINFSVGGKLGERKNLIPHFVRWLLMEASIDDSHAPDPRA